MSEELDVLRNRLDKQLRELGDLYDQKIMDHATRCLDNMKKEALRGNLSEAMIQGMYAKFYIDLAGKNWRPAEGA